MYINRLLRWMKSLIFKSKKSLPESPKQEIESSTNQNDVVLQALDVTVKQEQAQWFQKKNDLRNVKFDLNPIWDNGHTLYGTGDVDPDDYQPAAEIKAIVAEDEDISMNEVPDGYSPWKDYKKFPMKDYPLTPDEAIKLQSKD